MVSIHFVLLCLVVGVNLRVVEVICDCSASFLHVCLIAVEIAFPSRVSVVMHVLAFVVDCLLLLCTEFAIVVCVHTPGALLVGAVCEPLLAIFAAAASACVAATAVVYDVQVLAILPAIAADFFIIIGDVAVIYSSLFAVAVEFSVAFPVMVILAYAAYVLPASFALAVTVGA